MIRRLSATLVLLAAATAHAAPPGFAFLEVPATARASAMGGAFSAVAQGAEAAFWNPAGLVETERTEFSGTHYEWIERLRQDQFAIAGQLWGGGVVAGIRALYSEPIEQRDALGNLTGTFGAHDLEFLLGYGFDLGGGWSAGLTAQVVRERIAELSADTWATNLGVVYAPERWNGLRTAASLHQLGPAARYRFGEEEGGDVALPAALHLGAALPRAFGPHALTVAADARFTRGRPGVGALGAELSLPVGAMLRAGVRLGDDLGIWSVGAGYALRGLQLDYAFVPSAEDLADTHRFGLGARF